VKEKTYKVTMADLAGMDDDRVFSLKAKNKDQAMLKFLWLQIRGVDIKEIKPRKKRTSR
jgi:hypothetical protein